MSDPRNREDQLAYAGPGPTFAHVALALDAAELDGADVVIVGAPCDQATCYRPGTRFGPRAIRDADIVGPPSSRPHPQSGVDPFAVMRVLDHGDVGTYPGRVENVHAQLRTALDAILRVGAVPAVMGGDHSISLPMLEALAEVHGSTGYAVVHLDAHADVETGMDVVDHGNPFALAVERGALLPRNHVVAGVRGYWPSTPDDIALWGPKGTRIVLMQEVAERGVVAVVDELIAEARDLAPRTYLTIDIDVVDPAFAPGTGTPEVGGITSRDLLTVAGRIATQLDLCAFDVVEVNPMVDPTGITALAAHASVLEVLAGMATRRSGKAA